MNWVYMVWSMMGGAAFVLAFVHLTTWLRRPTDHSKLLFVIIAGAIAVIAIFEMLAMNTASPAQYAMLVRWGGVPVFVLMMAVMGFVRVFLGAGRPWLAVCVAALSVLLLVLGFATDPGSSFGRMPVLREVEVIGGATVTLARGTEGHWGALSALRNLLYLLFIVDCSVVAWRLGRPLARRRAMLVGGSIVLSTVVAAGHSALIGAGLIESVYIITPSCLVFLLAMSDELGSEMYRATEHARTTLEQKARLLENERRMALVANAIDLGIWEWDPGRKELWMSDGGRALFGFTDSAPRDLQRLLGAIDSEDRQQVARAMDAALKDAGSFQLTCRLQSSGASERWISLHGEVSSDGAGGSAVLRGMSRDITQQVRDERRFRQIVEDFPNAIFIVDRSGKLMLANAPAEKAFGYGRGDFNGLRLEDLLSEEFRSQAAAYRRGYFERPVKRQIGLGRELFGQRRDGSKFPIEVWATPFGSEPGDQALVTIVDVTDRRRLEREALEQRNELAHLSRVAVVGELSSSLAHELNQPLAAILSNAQAALRFLGERPGDLDEVREILRDIVNDDRRAGEVIRRLRAMLTKVEVTYQALDLNEVVSDVARLVQSDLTNRRVVLSTQLAPDLPAARCDRVQMQQVLLNLIVNACDAMAHLEPKDRVIGVSTASRDDGMVEVRVADAGTGIAQERIEKIFEPFQTTKADGMGVGLSVCRTIMHAHAGMIWAVNNPSRGATFCFTVPVFRELVA